MEYIEFFVKADTLRDNETLISDHPSRGEGFHLAEFFHTKINSLNYDVEDVYIMQDGYEFMARVNGTEFCVSTVFFSETKLFSNDMHICAGVTIVQQRSTMDKLRGKNKQPSDDPVTSAILRALRHDNRFQEPVQEV